MEKSHVSTGTPHHSSCYRQPWICRTVIAAAFGNDQNFSHNEALALAVEKLAQTSKVERVWLQQFDRSALSGCGTIKV